MLIDLLYLKKVVVCNLRSEARGESGRGPSTEKTTQHTAEVAARKHEVLTGPAAGSAITCEESEQAVPEIPRRLNRALDDRNLSQHHNLLHYQITST